MQSCVYRLRYPTLFVLLHIITHFKCSFVKARSNCEPRRHGFLSHSAYIAPRFGYASSHKNSLKSHSKNHDFHVQLHRKSLEAKEYQLHIPPTNDTKVKKIPEFTKQDNEALHVKETDILKLVDSGKIPDFRYPLDTDAESNVLSWHIDRPPDIYVIKFEGVVNVYPRESAVVGYNAALQLLGRGDEFSTDIPFLYYHLVLHSLPYLRNKQHFVLAALKYIKILHNQFNKVNEGLKESIEYLKVANTSSDPFQPVDMYIGTKRRSRPFMMSVKNDVFGVEKPIQRNLHHFKNLDGAEFGFSDEQLLQAYEEQQRKLEGLGDVWNDITLYRNSIPVSDLDADRFHHISFNHALVQAILHHITVWRMPVYIVSNYYTIDELERRLLPMLQYVSNNDIKSHTKHLSFHSLLDEPVSSTNWLSDILSYIIKGNDTSILPVHLFSDRLCDLNISESLSNEIKNLKLHFVDWGHSTYKEKLECLYSNKYIYINHTKKLVSLMTLPSSNVGRCWTTGYQLLPPIAEVTKFVENWKRHWTAVDLRDASGEPPQPVN